MDPADALFDRYVDKAPFVPGRKEEREKRCLLYTSFTHEEPKADSERVYVVLRRPGQPE